MLITCMVGYFYKAARSFCRERAVFNKYSNTSPYPIRHSHLHLKRFIVVPLDFGGNDFKDLKEKQIMILQPGILSWRSGKGR